MAKAKKSGKAQAETGGVAVLESIEDLEKLEAELVENLEEHTTPEDADATNLKLQSVRERIEVTKIKSLPTALMPGRAAVPIESAIPVEDIDVTGNHRLSESDADVERLARSMQTIGQQTPIGLRKNGERYELIYGFRRFTAAKRLGWPLIDAQVFPESTSPAEVELRRTAENLARREISPVEQAIAVARMIESIDATVEKVKVSGGTDADELLWKQVVEAGGTHAYVGALLGRSEAWVRDHAYVTKVGGKVRDLLIARRLDLGHARELAKLGDPAEADEIGLAAARDEFGLFGRSVEWVKKEVEGQLASLSRAAWNLDIEFGQFKKEGLPTGACSSCHYNSSANPGLFGIVAEEKQGRCGYRACFEARSEFAEAEIAKGLKSVEKAAKKNPGEVTVSDFVPVTVKASTFTRKAKAVLSGEAKVNEPAADTVRPQNDWNSPEAKAKREHDEKMRVWWKRVEGVILEKLKKSPGAVSLALLGWELLLDGFEVQPYSGAVEANRERALRNTTNGYGMDFVRKLAKPDATSLHEYERKVTAGVSVTYWPVEAVERVCDELGVDMPKPPAVPKLLAKADAGKGGSR